MPSSDNTMSQSQATEILDFWYGPLEKWDRSPEASAVRQNFWWHGGPQVNLLSPITARNAINNRIKNRRPLIEPSRPSSMSSSVPSSATSCFLLRGTRNPS